ncbi:hypothetical protein D3C78_1640530 [compost metagenome]
MAHHLHAELTFVGGHMAFDDILRRDLQMNADDIGMHRLVADVAVDEHRADDVARTQFGEVGAGA